MTPRFVLLKVEDLGRRVAFISDSVTGTTHKVHRRGSQFLNWANDTKVENAGLRRIAKEALA